MAWRVSTCSVLSIAAICTCGSGSVILSHEIMWYYARTRPCILAWKREITSRRRWIGIAAWRKRSIAPWANNKQSRWTPVHVHLISGLRDPTCFRDAENKRGNLDYYYSMLRNNFLYAYIGVYRHVHVNCILFSCGSLENKGLNVLKKFQPSYFILSSNKVKNWSHTRE